MLIRGQLGNLPLATGAECVIHNPFFFFLNSNLTTLVYAISQATVPKTCYSICMHHPTGQFVRLTLLHIHPCPVPPTSTTFRHPNLGWVLPTQVLPAYIRPCAAAAAEGICMEDQPGSEKP